MSDRRASEVERIQREFGVNLSYLFPSPTREIVLARNSGHLRPGVAPGDLMVCVTGSVDEARLRSVPTFIESVPAEMGTTHVYFRGVARMPHHAVFLPAGTPPLPNEWMGPFADRDEARSACERRARQMDVERGYSRTLVLTWRATPLGEEADMLPNGRFAIQPVMTPMDPMEMTEVTPDE